MQALNISKQTEAEKDNHLLECFYDSGAIKQLIDENKIPIIGIKQLQNNILSVLEVK